MLCHLLNMNMSTRINITISIVLMSLVEVMPRVIKTRSAGSQSVVFLTSRNKLVPEPYCKLMLPKEIVEELGRRVDTITLRTQNLTRQNLTEAYIVSKPIGKIKPIETDIVLVPLSQIEIVELSEYSDKTSKLRHVLDNSYQFEDDKSKNEKSGTIEWSKVLDFTHKPVTVEVDAERTEKVQTVATSTSSSGLTLKSDYKVFMSTTHKEAPSTFAKLKLPEKVMDALRIAIPPKKLIVVGVPSKELTLAYLASSKEFDPPGFLSISLPATLINNLQKFVV